MYEAPVKEFDLQPMERASLRDLLAPLFRHRRLLITSFLVIFALTLAILLSVGKRYESHMEILVNRERMDPMISTQATSQPAGADLPVSEEEINSEAELLRSQDVLTQVAIANGLVNSSHRSLLGRFGHKPSESVRLDQAVTRLGQDLQIKSIPKSDMLEVSYNSPDPKLAYGVLDTLGSLYIEKHMAVHRPPGSYEFFDAETQRYKNAMDDAEARLRSFGETHGVAAPDLQRSDLATQVASSIGQLHLAEQLVAADQSRIRKDSEQLQTIPARITTARTSAPPDMLMQQLGSDILKAEAKRTELATKYNNDYPLVREADEEIADAKNAFEIAKKTTYVTETTDRDNTHELLRQDLAKTESDLAAQMAALAATRQGIASMQAQMVRLDSMALQQSDLVRDTKADEDNYLMYESKREQARASDALDKNRISNVAIAVPPALPALPIPERVPAPAMAFGIAFIASLILAYLAAYLDPSFHAPEEVSESIGVPFVVTVSKKAA